MGYEACNGCDCVMRRGRDKRCDDCSDSYCEDCYDDSIVNGICTECEFKKMIKGVENDIDKIEAIMKDLEYDHSIKRRGSIIYYMQNHIKWIKKKEEERKQQTEREKYEKEEKERKEREQDAIQKDIDIFNENMKKKVERRKAIYGDS